jgi:hypothetical protein
MQLNQRCAYLAVVAADELDPTRLRALVPLLMLGLAPCSSALAGALVAAAQGAGTGLLANHSGVRGRATVFVARDAGGVATGQLERHRLGTLGPPALIRLPLCVRLQSR